MDDIAFLDVESSGLHATSFPIEVGWTLPVPGLPMESRIIAPAPTWRDWDASVVDLHAMDAEFVRREGAALTLVAGWLNDTLAGKAVFSDAVAADGFWLDRLFDAAEMARLFVLEPAVEAFKAVYGDTEAEGGLYSSVASVVDLVYPVLHRAGPDSRRLAAIHLSATSTAFRDQLAEAVTSAAKEL